MIQPYSQKDANEIFGDEKYPPPAAASERASCEPTGPAKVVAAVATGSLPVSSVLYLIERWSKNAGQWKSDVEYHKRPIFKGDTAAAISVASCEARASIYAVCIQDLRSEMARANQRQPEENPTSSGKVC